MTVTTLADLSQLTERHLPSTYRDRPHWRAVVTDLEAAARERSEDVATALTLAFAIEGIACRPRTSAARNKKTHAGD
jgi:hypothetical protein